MPLPDRIFKALMRVMPAELRGDFERDLTATFRAERAEQRSSLGLTRLWLATIADVVRTAPASIWTSCAAISYARRMLVRRPALTVTALVTLALGIGANTAIFSVVNGVLFAALPHLDADRLVLVEEQRGDRDPGTTGYYCSTRSRGERFVRVDRRVCRRVGGLRRRRQGRGARPCCTRDLGLLQYAGAAARARPRLRARRRSSRSPPGGHHQRRSVAAALRRRPVDHRAPSPSTRCRTLAGVTPPNMSELVTARKFPDSQVWTLLGYADTLPQACRSCRHIHVVGRLKDGMTTEQAEADLRRASTSRWRLA